MYHINDQQLDYILNDIRARGVEMEDLQVNLLDHICCIVEQDLEENGDFERFYQKTIQRFYKDALWEIEEETISLLTFKNYYAMKKSMIVFGTFSAVTMVLGIIFKYMHWPGASLFIVLGITSGSLFFLPLFFTLKAREKQSVKDKLVIAIGALAASLISLSILFKVMHWPWAGIMGMLSVFIMLVVFLPVYFFGGIRHPESKINTIASSVLIVLGCGLMFTLMRTPKSTRMIDIRDTCAFLTNEQIVMTEKRQLKKLLQNDSLRSKKEIPLSEKIDKACEELKVIVVEQQTGYKTIGSDFEGKEALLKEMSGLDLFDNPSSKEKIKTLIRMVGDYNTTIQAVLYHNTKTHNSLARESDPDLKEIPTQASILEYYEKGEMGFLTTLGILNQLNSIQMYVLQNQREWIAAN